MVAWLAAREDLIGSGLLVRTASTAVRLIGENKLHPFDSLKTKSVLRPIAKSSSSKSAIETKLKPKKSLEYKKQLFPLNRKLPGEKPAALPVA